MGEYELPDPKKDPLKAIVISYKTLKGIEFDDRGWDKVNWGRSAKCGKLLLEVCRSFEQAERCLTSLSKQFEDSGLSWTIETVLKHSHDWLSKNERRGYGTNARQRLFDAIAKRRSADKVVGDGRPTTSGEILTSLRDMQALPSETQVSGRDASESHG